MFPFHSRHSRYYHDFLRVSAGGHHVRLPLSSPKLVGIVSSRGTRTHQEDRSRVCCIHVNPLVLSASYKKIGLSDWNHNNLPNELLGQILYAGLFDGHGGASVSEYLHNELHCLLEAVEKHSIVEVYRWLKSHGGYFKRFRGGILQEWVENPQTTSCFDLDARLTLAFLEVRTTLMYSLG